MSMVKTGCFIFVWVNSLGLCSVLFFGEKTHQKQSAGVGFDFSIVVGIKTAFCGSGGAPGRAGVRGRFVEMAGKFQK